jgi:DNA-binding transcriptional regulator YiaG
MTTKTTDFTLQIPDAEGNIVRRAKIKVPVEWDEAIGEWMMTPEALRMVEDAKAREMGLIMPEEMKALRKSLGLTQAQMGALFQVGGKSWTRWEGGKYRPNRVISLLIRAVADGHLSADYLRGKENPNDCNLRRGAALVSNKQRLTIGEVRDNFWRSLVEDNPTIRNPMVRFAPRALCEFFDIVWNHAYECGAKSSTATSSAPRSTLHSRTQKVLTADRSSQIDKDDLLKDLVSRILIAGRGLPRISSEDLRVIYEKFWNFSFHSGRRDMLSRNTEILEALRDKAFTKSL